MTLSCAGYATDVIAYDVLIAWRDPHPYPCQIVECGPACDPADPACCQEVSTTCVVYGLSAWSDVDRVPAPATCSDVDQATPPIGAAVLVQVVAENRNGRGPMGPCP